MTEERSPLLWLHGASVAFGSVVALRDAQIAIRAGEVVAVVGANGSGKTTLLRALHGVAPLSGGRRGTNGVGVQAMIFQRPFMLRLSVWNNLRLGLWLARRDWPQAERHERAETALRRVGLAALRDRPAHALSGGEQQRLALARGWAVRPTVLFLDEPTANLDPWAKKEVESLLAGFAAEGMTLVMSTHHLGQVKRMATRVVYMDGGRVDTDLPTTEFFASGARGRVDLFLKGELSWLLRGG
jgi:tungstate transport system ATP-binding protein